MIRRNDQVRDSLIPGMEIRQLDFEKGDALEDELKAFVQAVAMRKPPEVDGRVGRNALQIALKVMEQINTTNQRCVAPGF